MEKPFELDIDQEKVRYEGEWLGTKELADKIKRMIDSQDFRIATAGSALEYLQKSVADAQEFSLKLAPDDADVLQKHAKRAELEIPAFIRQAVMAYIAAQPPLDADEQPAQKMTTITTEPAKPGEETDAVELTERKQQTSSTVLVDPSLQDSSKPPPAIEGDWFKKE